MYGTGVLDDSEPRRCLQRVSLDAFRSREPTRISQNLVKINRALQIPNGVGFKDAAGAIIGPLEVGR
jgi:hypothetical protein